MFCIGILQLSGVPCVWYRTVVRRRYRQSSSQRTETVSSVTSATSFRVADATGTAVVQPGGASIEEHAEKVVDHSRRRRRGGCDGGPSAGLG